MSSERRPATRGDCRNGDLEAAYASSGTSVLMNVVCCALRIAVGVVIANTIDQVPDARKVQAQLLYDIGRI